MLDVRTRVDKLTCEIRSCLACQLDKDVTQQQVEQQRAQPALVQATQSQPSIIDVVRRARVHHEPGANSHDGRNRQARLRVLVDRLAYRTVKAP